LSSDTYELLIWHFVLKTNVGMAGREIVNARGEGARKIFRHKEIRGKKTSNLLTPWSRVLLEKLTSEI
jgi:hypothetical protein